MPPLTIAQQLAAKQREISVAEFFERNRQILGFDNPQRSLLTTVKEGTDNGVDAGRLSAIGCAAKDPLVPNTTAENRATR